MSLNLEDVLNYGVNMNARKVLINRGGVDSAQTIKVAPSNYFRHLASLQDIPAEGREFIVTKKQLAIIGFDTIERNDAIVDPELGLFVITEVRDMVTMGKIIGYRVRTG